MVLLLAHEAGAVLHVHAEPPFVRRHIRSAAVPYGSAVWLDTTEPLSARVLQRAVMAQDTGSAIVGAVRADFFWGWGGDAEAQAGRMKQTLRLWVLWPRA